jgi:PhnB protein
MTTKTAPGNATQVKAIPEGYHALTPRLIYGDASKAIDFIKKAFAAEELVRMACPDTGAIVHASLKIGDARVDLASAMPGCPAGTRAPAPGVGETSTVHVYTRDVDAVFKQAVASGATAKMPPTDMYWGDRLGVITDPQGHVWSLATHKEDLSPAEMAQRQKAFVAQMKAQGESCS